jgi:hypothetical protein
MLEFSMASANANERRMSGGHLMANDGSLDGSGRDDSSAPNTASCVHPWIHLRLQSTGEGQVCCRYRTNISKDGAPLSLRSHSFDAIWNADEMRNVRRDMVAGKRVSGCAECYQEEDAGGVSMRTRDNTAWEQGWLNEGRASLDALMAQAVASDFRLPYLPVNIVFHRRRAAAGAGSRRAAAALDRHRRVEERRARRRHERHGGRLLAHDGGALARLDVSISIDGAEANGELIELLARGRLSLDRRDGARATRRSRADLPGGRLILGRHA